MKNILISACLTGRNCKYNGGNNYNSCTELLKKEYRLIPICPECDGGLSTPREPSELLNGSVISHTGKDVTRQFLMGAEIALKTAIENNCVAAVLKQRSPSCGSAEIYDGTFCGKTVKGNGVTADLLKKHGIAVYDEETFIQLLNKKRQCD